MQGYWNGIPTEVKKVSGTIREWTEDDPPQAWWKHLGGQRISAVEVVVSYGAVVIYLWDGDGSGWRKVTEGVGSPSYGHKEVPLIDVEPIEASEVIHVNIFDKE